MSKLIFSTLSILALLLSGTNCATGRGGGGGDSQTLDRPQDGIDVPQGGREAAKLCTLELVLGPGDACSGPNYSIRNNAGKLEVKGPYLKNKRIIFIGRGAYGPRSPGDYKCGALHLIGNGWKGDAWIIKSLPEPPGEGGSPTCTVGLVLNPGDACSGPDYSIRNNAGKLEAEGPYIDSCRVRVEGAKFTVNGRTVRRYVCDDLGLTLPEDGNAWTINSLPPPAAMAP